MEVTLKSQIVSETENSEQIVNEAMPGIKWNIRSIYISNIYVAEAGIFREN